jgi:predicted helicase
VSQATFPLYRYPDGQSTGVASQSSWLEPYSSGQDDKYNNRTPNLAPTFIADLEAKLGLTFNPIQRHTAETEFGPEDVFHYIYAILQSPTYRERYAEFLKIDFPRIPLTADAELFRELAALGQELVALHLLESPAVTMPITSYPVPGDNRVEKGYPKFTQALDEPAGRVHINKTQYFDGVPPEVWEFYVGGYQVCDKWLKDRRGRVLTYDDLTHYQQVVVALQRTISLMDDIDAVIPEWPIV